MPYNDENIKLYAASAAGFEDEDETRAEADFDDEEEEEEEFSSTEEVESAEDFRAPHAEEADLYAAPSTPVAPYEPPKKNRTSRRRAKRKPVCWTL